MLVCSKSILVHWLMAYTCWTAGVLEDNRKRYNISLKMMERNKKSKQHTGVLSSVFIKSPSTRVMEKKSNKVLWRKVAFAVLIRLHYQHLSAPHAGL